jgi:predicted kinase
MMTNNLERLEKKVVLMLGVPGAGKSTYIRGIPGEVVVASADHYFIDRQTGQYLFNGSQLGRAHSECLENFKAAIIRPGAITVVVDNTNTQLKALAPYVEFANQYGIIPTLVHVVADPKVAAARNVHGVPEESVMNMHTRLQTLVSILKGSNHFPSKPEWKYSYVEV